MFLFYSIRFLICGGEWRFVFYYLDFAFWRVIANCNMWKLIGVFNGFNYAEFIYHPPFISLRVILKGV